MRRATDLRARLAVYLVTDPTLVPPHRLVDAALAAVQGGATMVQLRDKQACTRDLLAAARALQAGLRGRVPLIVNDRADVALAAEADGVHLGASDLPVADARRLFGPDRIVGVSLERVDDDPGAADYAAVSPVYSTPTKRDAAPPLGLEGVRALRARHPALPLVGIGGLSADNAPDVIAAGADGVAVVSALLTADDVPAAAARLLTAVQRSLR